jgi:hypothetical protein
LVAVDEAEARAVRQEVIAYCSAHGTHVTCHAPYAIPLQASAAALDGAMDDAELRAYLVQVLGTTLTLQDGTRVKPLLIPWSSVNAHQRALVLTTIREAVVSELRQFPSARLRLEFNELPDDVRRMLAQLGEAHSNMLEWVEVDM